jgi:hypothetical protein
VTIETITDRLVEVICQQERGKDAWRKIAHGYRDELSALSAEIDRMVGELSSIRMEHEAELAALREQMADLRAAVQVERRKHGPGRAHDGGVNYPCGRCDALEFVLALIDSGADR